jgi:hypothetical protein
MTDHNIHIYPDGRMKPKDAACYTGFAEGTLANWRVLGIGPKFFKKRGRIFYPQAKLDSWLHEERICSTTAQARLTQPNS